MTAKFGSPPPQPLARIEATDQRNRLALVLLGERPLAAALIGYFTECPQSDRTHFLGGCDRRQPRLAVVLGLIEKAP